MQLIVTPTTWGWRIESYNLAKPPQMPYRQGNRLDIQYDYFQGYGVGILYNHLQGME